MTTTIDGRELDRVGILAELLKANDAAKAISRRGRGAQATEEYEDAHASIDDALRALERAP